MYFKKRFVCINVTLDILRDTYDLSVKHDMLWLLQVGLSTPDKWCQSSHATLGEKART